MRAKTAFDLFIAICYLYFAQKSNLFLEHFSSNIPPPTKFLLVDCCMPSSLYTPLISRNLFSWTISAFRCRHACIFAGINVRGTCLLNEKHKSLYPQNVLAIHACIHAKRSTLPVAKQDRHTDRLYTITFRRLHECLRLTLRHSISTHASNAL